MDANEFLRKFQNLEGVTVAEKKKSFGKLLHEAKNLLEDPVASKDVLANLEANTYLENQFRVEILLASRCVPELFEILKSGNEVLVSKIIKHKSMLKEAFCGMTVLQIVDDLLPPLSYCVRIKLLKGLTLAFENDDKLSDLFDYYSTKYGLPDALPILFGCSVNKIESVIKNNAVFLTKSQVVKLLRKAPKLFPVYVEEHFKHRGQCDYLLNNSRFRNMLASKYYDIFEPMKIKYNLYVSYGRRTTKKIFEKEKDKILAEPAKYTDTLKQTVIFRNLRKNGQFKQYFKSAFPKSSKDFFPSNYRIQTLLSKYPKNKRYQLLKDTFEEVYNMRFIECPSKIDEYVLQLMLCSEEYAMERCEVAAVKMKVTNDPRYAVYQSPEKSIPYLKREINLSTNSGRREILIRLLVKNCQVNNDMTSLVEVVQYVTARHKNEHGVVLAFLKHIENHFDMHYFEKELWDAIIELVDLYFLMNPKENRYENILLHYAEFRYNSGKSIKESIAKYRLRDQSGSELFDHDCENGKFLQQAIKDFTVLFLEKDKKEDSDYFAMFEKLYNWNLKHQDFPVSYLDYPELVDNITELANTETYNDRMSDFLRSKDRNHFIEDLLDAYWQTRANKAERRDIEYFFRWYPSLLLKHKNSFFSTELHETSENIEYLLRWMKRYDHLEFPQEVVQFCQDKFTTEDKVEPEIKFECLFAMLIRFMRPADFINYIAEYKPKDLSLDNWEVEEKALYGVKSGIAKSFRYTEHAAEMFPLIMSYCGGDFLKYVLDSFYNYFHRSPHNGLQPYLEQLSSSAVSVRKHSLFLTCRVSDLESRQKILKSFISTEKNASLQKRCMLIALASFLEYHSSDFWQLFSTSLALLKNNDKESFKNLVDTKKFIPKSYYALYYQEMWNLIEMRSLNNSLKNKLRNNLVEKIGSAIDLFPAEFCCKVIETSLLKFSDGNSSDYELLSFLFSFLARHKDPDRFTDIVKVLESSKAFQNANSGLYNLEDKLGFFVAEFPAEFCYKIINTLLLKFYDGRSYDSDINRFVYKFLLYHKDPDRFSKVLEILLLRSKASQADEKKMRKEISYFITMFCDFYHVYEENEKWDKKLLQNFADQLLNLYPPVAIFPDFLLLSFTSKLIASKDLKEYAHKSSILIDDLLQKFGVYDLEKIRTAICTTLKFFYKRDDSKNAIVEFIHELLAVKSSEVNQVLCLSILLYQDRRNKPGFEDCLKIFEDSSIPHIQATLLQRGN